jgi:hypothetical protein
MWARKWKPLVAAIGIGVPCLIGAGPAAAAAPDHAGAKAKVYLVDCMGDRAKVKPTFVVLACADGGAVVAKATWTHWGAAVTTARARLVENTCVPSCVQGQFVSEPARVTVRSIVRRDGRLEYSHIRVVPDAPNPHHFKTVAESLPG